MRRQYVLSNKTIYDGRLLSKMEILNEDDRKSNISVAKSNYLDIISMKKGELAMNELGTRLQNARTALQLSQEYVAKQLCIGRAAVSLIELGKRKISSEELIKFSNIYGIPADELLSGKPVEMPSSVFTRKFSELDEIDQREIMNLIEFKRMMKNQMRK